MGWLIGRGRAFAGVFSDCFWDLLLGGFTAASALLLFQILALPFPCRLARPSSLRPYWPPICHPTSFPLCSDRAVGFHTWCSRFCLTARCGRGAGGEDRLFPGRFAPECLRFWPNGVGELLFGVAILIWACCFQFALCFWGLLWVGGVLRFFGRVGGRRRMSSAMASSGFDRGLLPSFWRWLFTWVWWSAGCLGCGLWWL